MHIFAVGQKTLYNQIENRKIVIKVDMHFFNTLFKYLQNPKTKMSDSDL